MLFEAFDREGNRVMYTSHESCIPTKAQFQDRMKNGDSFKLDGKVVKTYEKLLEALIEKK